MFRILVVLATAVTIAACSGSEPRTYDLSAESNAAYLRDNAEKSGVVTRPSGLQYRVIKSGAGRSPKPTDMVRVTYSGRLINGVVFDETTAGQTAEFEAGKLIAGWVEALSLMKEGDRWELVIPSNLGYGETGTPGGPIGPNQTLVFEMELIAVTTPAGP
jgi:FKBP-type peptidyl-prolyl cis-trans isomerase